MLTLEVGILPSLFDQQVKRRIQKSEFRSQQSYQLKVDLNSNQRSPSYRRWGFKPQDESTSRTELNSEFCLLTPDYFLVKMWAIRSEIEGNMKAYEAVITNIKKQSFPVE
ncbi:MAG: hypothetical protein WAN66_18070 [Limnoraphis robusta]